MPMTITFINRSQQTVLMRTNDGESSLPPQQQINLHSSEPEPVCTLTPAMSSSYREFGGTITGYDFITAVQYRFVAADQTATVALQVIQLSGMEFYTYVNAVSSDAAVTLLSAAVADEEAFVHRVQHHKSFQKAQKKPKSGVKLTAVLDILGGTPLAVIFFIVGKVKFSITAGVIGVLLAYLIAAVTVFLLHAVLQRTPLGAEATQESKADELHRCMDKQQVLAAITDTSRYKNYC